MKCTNEKFFLKNDFVVGAVMILISAVLQFEVSKITPASSRMLPQIIIIVMLICGAISLMKSLMNNGKNSNSNLLLNKRQIVALIFLVIFCAVVPVLGFYFSLFLLFISEGVLMFDKTKPLVRQLSKLVALSLVLTLILSAAFINIFKLITPKGIFF